MKYESSRVEYPVLELVESAVAANPVAQLQRWLEEVYADGRVIEPNAMCVASVGDDGQPSARMVLLRRLDERGLAFFTSYFSRKGRELTAQPRVAATFYWAPLARQVRIEGTASELPEDESDEYFASRPRAHQLSAWSSEQSEPLADRDTLIERVTHFDGRFEGEEIPRPHSWGGYLIAPSSVEFWQGRANRLHDRLIYRRTGRDWYISRLQP